MLSSLRRSTLSLSRHSLGTFSCCAPASKNFVSWSQRNVQTEQNAEELGQHTWEVARKKRAVVRRMREDDDADGVNGGTSEVRDENSPEMLRKRGLYPPWDEAETETEPTQAVVIAFWGKGGGAMPAYMNDLIRDHKDAILSRNFCQSTRPCHSLLLF